MSNKKKIIASIYPFPFFIGEGHNTNFSLIKGNEIFSCEEGKINGVVNSNCDRFPERSMFLAFKKFNLDPRDVDHWVFGCRKFTPEKPSLKYFFSHFKAKSYEELKSKKGIHYVNHHLAHASLAIYGSGLTNGAFLCLDDGGDESFPYDTAWGIFEKNSIKLLGKHNKGGWGLARFHNFICESVGYLGNTDNGKIMGLAAYGSVNKVLYEKLKKFLSVTKEGFSANFLLRHNPVLSRPRYDKLKLDAYQSYKVLNRPNPPLELKEITKFFSNLDVAATGQKVVEDIAIETVKNILNKTKKRNLVCSGGFFQNVSFNQRLLKLGLDNIYIPSAPNDAGLSLGGALYYKMSQEKTRPKKVLSPFLGPSFSNNYIENLIKEFNLEFKISKNVSFDAAKFISKGKIIGWFQGRSELGPRSLGARSVLADPRKIENKAKVNQFLKKREWFMPYAPSILAEKMNFFFKNPFQSPYMSYALKIKKNHSKIAAAVHVDKTCRPQTVSKLDNQKFYRLIKYFYKLTGVPAILNTSFNRHGIATIVTPRQAIEHLLNGNIEILVIENIIVFRKQILNLKSKKPLKEKYYIFVEKIIHIIEAMLNNDKDKYKILNKNLNLLKKNNINFEFKKKLIVINKKKIKIKNLDREDLWKMFIPSIIN